MTFPPEQAVGELEKLWKAVFGGPPAVRSEPRTLAQFLVDNLPPAPAYEPSVMPEAADLSEDEPDARAA